jgi:hypothetical protein
MNCGAFRLFEDLFEDLKLFGVSIGKHSADFREMLAEDWNNQVFTAFCKSYDSYPPIVGAFRPADESFFEQAIDRHADGPGSEVDFRADCVHDLETLVERLGGRAVDRFIEICFALKVASPSYRQKSAPQRASLRDLPASEAVQ